MIFYPDAHPESTSVDGWVRHLTGAVGSGIDWSTLVAAAGTGFDDSIYPNTVHFWADQVTDKWLQIVRGFVLFDTSSFPDGVDIINAKLRLYGSYKQDYLNAAPTTNIYSANPASNTALQASDFTTLGTTPYCDTPITYANWNSNGWNTFILNATGLAAISKTGITKIGVRNANYDVANVVPPNWISLKASEMAWYQSEEGAEYRPQLIVNWGGGSQAHIFG